MSEEAREVVRNVHPPGDDSELVDALKCSGFFNRTPPASMIGNVRGHPIFSRFPRFFTCSRGVYEPSPLRPPDSRPVIGGSELSSDPPKLDL
jgi:hypothetical protein